MIYQIIFPHIVNILPIIRPFFSVVNNIYTSATTLSSELNAIFNWDFQWKMIFNSDLIKEGQEVIFSWKIKKWLLLTVLLNTIPLRNRLFQKTPWFGIRCKVKLPGTYKKYCQKISKTIELLCKFQQILPRSSFLAIYNVFIRSWLTYADTIYD